MMSTQHPALPPRSLAPIGLNDKERETATQTFQKLDNDRDGTLTRGQLYTFLREYFSPNTAPSQFLMDEIDKAMSQLGNSIDLWKAMNSIVAVKAAMPKDLFTETVNSKPAMMAKQNSFTGGVPTIKPSMGTYNQQGTQNPSPFTSSYPVSNPFTDNSFNTTPSFNSYNHSYNNAQPITNNQYVNPFNSGYSQPAVSHSSNTLFSNPQTAYPSYTSQGPPATPYSTSTPTPIVTQSSTRTFANVKPTGNPFSPSFPTMTVAPANPIWTQQVPTNAQINKPSLANAGPRPVPVASARSAGPNFGADTTTNALSGTHYISVEEKRAFCEYLNSNEKLRADADLAHLFAIDPNTDQIFGVVSDGALFCKYLNIIQPGIIPPASIKLRPRNTFEASENHMRALEAAKRLGCSVVNIGPEDLIQGKPHLVMGLIWQLIKHDVLSKVSLREHPEIYRLAANGTSLQQISESTPEDVLLHWINYHLRNAGYPRAVSNFSQDMRDCSAYAVLMHQIAPNMCTLEALSETDPLVRATMVVQNAQKLGCDRFVSPADILNGNSRLNLAFAADLFNKHSALAMPSLEEFANVRQQNANIAALDDAEAKLRQIHGDQQLAYELQQQEIALYREQKLREQQQLAEQEAMLIAQQREEEEMLKQQKRFQNMALQEQEAMALAEQRKEQRKFDDYKQQQQREIARQEEMLREQERGEGVRGQSRVPPLLSRHPSSAGGVRAGAYGSAPTPTSSASSRAGSEHSAYQTPEEYDVPYTYSTLAPPAAARASRLTTHTPRDTTHTTHTTTTTNSNVSMTNRKAGVFEKIGRKVDRTVHRR